MGAKFVCWTCLVLTLGACEKERNFSIAAARQPSSLLLCIADQMQLWDPSYPIPTVHWTEAGQDAFSFFAEGRADLALASVSTFVPSLIQSPDIVMLTEVYNSARGVQVVVRSSRDFKSSRGLSGKRIGYVEGTSAEIFLEYFLLTEGVNLGDVRKYSLELPRLKEHFASGAIDAMVLWEPELSRFKKQYPEIALTEFRSFVHESKAVLLGRARPDSQGSQFIEGTIKALINAEKLYWENPEESFVAYSRCLNGEGDRNALRESLIDARGEVKITNSLKLNYDRNREWLILRKGVPETALPTFYNIIQPEYLRRIRARGITLGGAQ